ncbi:autophagy-related protein [Talaromyces proteolyticus]|uniref:Autophagy-related protein 101 n=1 Tax=Talaromyces proteolyticus TaxID=1131652 RepID=A0AAD4L3K6_9EURO|nr:autophagy-related protein [Talaromyces proteolyticus]KAH8702569.1 autophagy-related protein [Talaromyces proteolyticus]
MEPRRNPPEYFLEIFADTNSVKDVLKGVLNLIFFHRYFPSIRPGFVDVLDLTLPTVSDVELETLIDSRVNALVRQHLSTPSNSYSGGNGVRGRIAVEFFERKRKKSGMWFGGLTGKGEEEVCWEIWTLDVTIATPRTESAERSKVRKAMENMLQKAALKILTIVNRDKDHIPPITTSDSNPFPYRIVLNPGTDGWGNRIGLY